MPVCLHFLLFFPTAVDINCDFYFLHLICFMFSDHHSFLALLHVVLITGALNVKINSYSEERLLQREFGQDSSNKSMNIMWVPSCLNEQINHVVPLLKMTPKQEKEGACDLAYQDTEACLNVIGGSTSSTLLKCKHCLRQYHTACITEASPSRDWSCHCYVRSDSLSW